MKAYVLTETGPAITEVPTPKPRPGQVLVKQAANALNRIDIIMAAGGSHGARGGVGAILGTEWSGEVVELGEGVRGLSLGQRVMGTGSGFADYACVPQGLVMPIPDANMSFETAACLPVALRTMHNAVVTAGELQPGQSVLVQGASSGVGLMAMQVAKVMGAGLVIGSSTNPERRARLADHGADLAIDSRDPAWVDQVLQATDGQGVDLVIDQVSGPLLTPNMRATKILGRIVNVGRLGGEKGEFDANRHALRRISYIGVTFRTRTPAEAELIDKLMVEDLWGPLTEGKLTLPIDSVFAFADADQAMARMAANAHFGKIVLRH